MQNFIYRLATTDDTKSVFELEKQCFATDRISCRQIRYLFQHAKAINLVAELNDEVVACVICLVRAKPRPARLYSIAAKPVYRGKGLARQLITRLFAELSKIDCHRCRLEVRLSQINAQAMYRDFGFKEIKRLPSYYQDGESAIQMETTLTAREYV